MAVTSLALEAIATGRAADQLAIRVAQRQGQAIDLRLRRERDRSIRGKPQEPPIRSTKSVTSCSLNALSSDSIGTAWRSLAKPRAGLEPTRVDGEFRTRQRGKAHFDCSVADAQGIVVRIRDRGRVVLIVAFVVLGDVLRQALELSLGLRLRQVVDRDDVSGFGFHEPTTIIRSPASIARPRRGPGQ